MPLDENRIPRIAAKLRPLEYKGWYIEYDLLDRPQLAEFYCPSLCFGKITATKTALAGALELVQPIWLTLDQVKSLRSPLDKESALTNMLSNGLRLLKLSIRNHEKGILKIRAERNGAVHAPRI